MTIDDKFWEFVREGLKSGEIVYAGRKPGMARFDVQMHNFKQESGNYSAVIVIPVQNANGNIGKTEYDAYIIKNLSNSEDPLKHKQG